MCRTFAASTNRNSTAWPDDARQQRLCELNVIEQAINASKQPSFATPGRAASP
jgi:hypothetical protein